MRLAASTIRNAARDGVSSSERAALLARYVTISNSWSLHSGGVFSMSVNSASKDVVVGCGREAACGD